MVQEGLKSTEHYPPWWVTTFAWLDDLLFNQRFSINRVISFMGSTGTRIGVIRITRVQGISCRTSRTASKVHDSDFKF